MSRVYKVQVQLSDYDTEWKDALLPFISCHTFPSDTSGQRAPVSGTARLFEIMSNYTTDTYLFGPIYWPSAGSYGGNMEWITSRNAPFRQRVDFLEKGENFKLRFTSRPDLVLAGNRTATPALSTPNQYIPMVYSGKYVEGMPVNVCATAGLNSYQSCYSVILMSDNNFDSNTKFKVLRIFFYNSGEAWAYTIGESILKELLITELLRDVRPDYNPDNPYEPGGPSGPSDVPPGTFDDTSDPIPIPPIPTVSAADTGFTRIYNPTLSQVQDLARYLWTDTSVIETIWNHIKQFFESPMEAIIGFNLVPCKVPDGGSKNFALMFIDTGVSMNTAATQFVDVDCGSVALERYYGSALDQSPYTKVSCFLPYIGMVQLNTDEVMGATLGVTYRIDIVSGSCVAMITVDGNVLYQYSGHCAITVPFSAADFSNYVSAAISVAKLAIGAAVGGGIGAISSAGIDPEQQTNIIKTTTTTETVTTNALTGSERRSFSTKVKEEPIDSAMTSASFLGLTPRNISNTVGEVVTSKPHVEHSGSFSGNSGYLGVRRPYLIIERPRMCMPEQYQRFNGFPAMYTQDLSSCSGFTQVQQVQLTGMTATNPEQSEILQLLKSGVIL